MEPERRARLRWRFSLGEILVAVAIDAVLVASVLDYVRTLNGQPPSYVYLGVLVLTFGVVPWVLVPAYWITFALRVPRFRRWHTRWNGVVMTLDVIVVALAVLTIYRYDTNRTRHIQLIASFVAIGYTMFVVYTIAVHYLKSGRQPSEPAPDKPALSEPISTRGPDSSKHGDGFGPDPR